MSTIDSKQTAVDIFCLTISDHIEAIFNGSIQQDEFANRMRESYNEAKQKEKEQIINACYEGMHAQGFDPNKGRAQQYYNETYKK